MGIFPVDFRANSVFSYVTRGLFMVENLKFVERFVKRLVEIKYLYIYSHALVLFDMLGQSNILQCMYLKRKDIRWVSLPEISGSIKYVMLFVRKPTVRKHHILKA